MSIIALGVLVSAFAACTRTAESPGDPTGRLKDYISRSFSAKDPNDRKEMMEYLTGEAKTRLGAWSDEQFRQAFIDSKRQFLKLAFKEVRTVSPSEVSVTYEITYVDQGKGVDTKITNKKLAQMVNEQGKWYIAEVRNIKELIEYKNEMSLP